jgi:hypothetical protein
MNHGYIFNDRAFDFFLITMVIFIIMKYLMFLAAVTSTLIPGLTPREGLMQILIPTPL